MRSKPKHEIVVGGTVVFTNYSGTNALREYSELVNDGKSPVWFIDGEQWRPDKKWPASASRNSVVRRRAADGDREAQAELRKRQLKPLKTYSAVVPWDWCRHRHRTRAAAKKCGRKFEGKNGPRMWGSHPYPPKVISGSTITVSRKKKWSLLESQRPKEIR